MVKIPDYMKRSPKFVCHPATTLKEVARALEIDAWIYRHEKNTAGSNALLNAARSLRAVAGGRTWADAFDWGEV